MARPSSSVAATINSDQQERFRAAFKAATNREELLDALRLGFPQRTPLGRRYLRLLAEAIIKDDRPNILVMAGVLRYLSSPAHALRGQKLSGLLKISSKPRTPPRRA